MGMKRFVSFFSSPPDWFSFRFQYWPEGAEAWKWPCLLPNSRDWSPRFPPPRRCRRRAPIRDRWIDSLPPTEMDDRNGDTQGNPTPEQENQQQQRWRRLRWWWQQLSGRLLCRRNLARYEGRTINLNVIARKKEANAVRWSRVSQCRAAWITHADF